MDRRQFLRTAAGLAGLFAAAGLPGGSRSNHPFFNSAQAASLSALAESAGRPGEAIFGTTEIASNSFKALPQWARVLGKMRAEGPLLERCAQNTANCRKHAIGPWHQAIASARGLDRKATLNQVNRFFNKWPYKLDGELYGVSEYWASPIEFMRRSGDCEDYSIAKYFALRQLGFKKEELRVIILFDQIRNIGHAVLAVYEPNDILVLDSLSNIIFSHRKYKHYKPQYSMNETTRWAHVTI